MGGGHGSSKTPQCHEHGPSEMEAPTITPLRCTWSSHRALLVQRPVLSRVERANNIVAEVAAQPVHKKQGKGVRAVDRVQK